MALLRLAALVLLSAGAASLSAVEGSGSQANSLAPNCSAPSGAGGARGLQRVAWSMLEVPVPPGVEFHILRVTADPKLEYR